MHWLYLIIAILLEAAGTTCMKLSQGFTRPVFGVLLFVFYISCFVVLTLALKKIEVSLAYAIWSGVGTALIAIIGILWFKEPVSTVKILGVGLIIAGVVVLNLSGSHTSAKPQDHKVTDEGKAHNSENDFAFKDRLGSR